MGQLLHLVSLTEDVGEVSAEDLQQEDVDRCTDFGVDGFGGVSACDQNLREIRRGAGSGGLDGCHGELVLAESAAQHGEQVTHVLPFHVEYQYRADEKCHDLPHRH